MRSNYMTLTGCAALLSFFATSVNAHGYVGFFENGGKTYKGPGPVDQDGISASGPIRQANTEQPVTASLFNNVRLACDQASNAPAPDLATVAAGSKIAVQWFNGEGTTAWPHDKGPVMTYMAPCAKDDCSDDPTTLSFFKIAENGQVTEHSDTWGQEVIKDGGLWNITVPTSIPSGKYIMRHELINLINGPGQNEAYPSCFQLDITGGQSTSTPAAFVAALGSSFVAKFPGAYDPTAATFSKYAVYDDETTKDYVFPGPNVFTAGGSGGGGGATTSPAPPTTTKSAKLSTTTVHSSSTVTSKPSSSQTTQAPMVITTTITKVFVMTMTIPMDGSNNQQVLNASTKTKSTAAPTTTASVADDDDCGAETTTSAPSTTTAPSKRHARRSERWRAAAASDRS